MKAITSIKEYTALAKSNRNAFVETPAGLLENGMCLCDTCGEVASMDDGLCTSCGEFIVIFKTK